MNSSKKKTKKRIKKFIDEKVNSSSLLDFTILIFVGVGLGMILSLFNTRGAFMISYTFLVTSTVLSFVIYIIPKFLGIFKKRQDELPPSFYLAKGINNETPKVKEKAKVKLITIDL